MHWTLNRSGLGGHNGMVSHLHRPENMCIPLRILHRDYKILLYIRTASREKGMTLLIALLALGANRGDLPELEVTGHPWPWELTTHMVDAVPLLVVFWYSGHQYCPINVYRRS